jgi:plastocyanin
MRVKIILPLLACACIGLACADEEGVIVDFVVSGTTFTPASITLPATTTNRLVRWGFSSGPHNVTFEDGATGSGDRSSGVFERDYSAVAVGTHRFRCTLHSTDFATGMVGSVIRN